MNEELDLFAEEGSLQELWSEDMPDARSAGCCWNSAATFGSAGTFGSTASTASSASTASCSC